MPLQGVNMLGNTAPSKTVKVAYWLYDLEDSVYGEAGFLHIINPSGHSYNYILQSNVNIISATHAQVFADVKVGALDGKLMVEVYHQNGIIYAGYRVDSAADPHKLLDMSPILPCEYGGRLHIIGKPDPQHVV